MKRGDILLVRGKGFISHMIRFVTASEWNHAAWVLDSVTLLESTFSLFGKRGVQIGNLSKYDDLNKVFIRPKLTDEQLDRILQFAFTKIGQTYDVKLIFSIFRRWLFRVFFLGYPGRVRHDAHAWICSETIATPAYKIENFKFSDGIPVQQITPGDLWDSVALGKCEKVEDAKDTVA